MRQRKPHGQGSGAKSEAKQSEIGLHTHSMERVKAAQQTKKVKANTRLNKTGLVLYIDPKLNKVLRTLALDRDTSVHALGLAGLRLLLDKLDVAVPADYLPDQLLLEPNAGEDVIVARLFKS